jgi:hypothetical protein
MPKLSDPSFQVMLAMPDALKNRLTGYPTDPPCEVEPQKRAHSPLLAAG